MRGIQKREPRPVITVEKLHAFLKSYECPKGVVDETLQKIAQRDYEENCRDVLERIKRVAIAAVSETSPSPFGFTFVAPLNPCHGKNAKFVGIDLEIALNGVEKIYVTVTKDKLWSDSAGLVEFECIIEVRDREWRENDDNMTEWRHTISVDPYKSDPNGYEYDTLNLAYPKKEKQRARFLFALAFNIALNEEIGVEAFRHFGIIKPE